MDFLKIKKSHISGVSGGRAYAIACSSVIPERIITTTLISSVAPPNVEGYLKKQLDDNTFLLYLFQRCPKFAWTLLFKMGSLSFRSCPSEINKESIFSVQMCEAYKQGVKGAVQDMILITKDWGG